MAGNIPTKTAIVSRPAVPPPVRVRQNVERLSATDPILVRFAEAIGIMKGRALDDPTSWRYQAAIHDYTAVEPAATFEQRRRSGDINNRDPLAQPGDPLPGDANTFWRQCQHNCWFFLPWHRMYLHFFEKIIMKIVQDQGGPSDWALPYWNYSDTGDSARIPAPLITPANTSNNLFVNERTPRANQGLPFFNAGDTDVRRALQTTSFENVGAVQGFGGLRDVNHPPRRFGAGAVESSPHNTVHGTVGGANGFMLGFITAPLDPIFWMHHCNIDRLWEVWMLRRRRQGGTGIVPTDSDWLTRPFPFHNANGVAESMSSQQVVDTRAAPLSYIYDDTRDPLGGA